MSQPKVEKGRQSWSRPVVLNLGSIESQGFGESVSGVRRRFDEKATLPVLGFVPINKPILTASYEVAYLIAKQGKPLTIGETLVKPAVLKRANIMLEEETEVKLSQIPLSNDTISYRIEDMSKDILAQVVADLISSPAKFRIQLDETTDVSNLSQLAVLVCYVKDDVINEDFLFCKPLTTTTTTTKAVEVKKPVDNFFKDNSLSWDMVSAVCSDRVPVTLERKSGFGAAVKADAPHIIVAHCILHRHALATKTLPPKLSEILKIVDCVNCMQSSALRHRIFSELCKEMGTEFEVLLYHSNIRWSSRGLVLNRVFAGRVEFTLFLQEHQHCHADCFKNSEFILILVHLADIFAALNHLNHKMQGGGFDIIETEENLKAFQKKKYRYGNGEQRTITSQTFPCWTTVGFVEISDIHRGFVEISDIHGGSWRSLTYTGGSWRSLTSTRGTWRNRITDPAGVTHTAVTLSEPAAVTLSEPAAVILSEPAAVTLSEPAAVSLSEPAAVTLSEPAAVTLSEPAAVSLSEPAAVTISEPAAA
ncbi:hypothetical protein FHG87_017790 [Trinorchestia longiramus]|nr:hypothetical protein FHG87_017790 [Trinorchestia longiramus]